MVRTDARPTLEARPEQAPDRVDDLILATAERFVTEHRAELGDVSIAAAGEGREFSGLVTRAYAQAMSDGARDRALDPSDNLLFAGAYGVDKALRDTQS